MEILEYGFFYHIFNRGNNRERLFYCHEDYLYFLSLYSKYIHPIADMYSYCLLPNHFHFLLRLKELLEIESLDLRKKKEHQHFSNFFNAYAKYMNCKYDRTGSLFQERYKRKRVTTEIYLKHLIHYIHTNPIHHEISNNYSNYPYSSYLEHLQGGPTFLQRDHVIRYFGDKENYIYTHRKRGRIILIKKLIEGD